MLELISSTRQNICTQLTHPRLRFVVPQHYIPTAANFSDLEKTVRYVVDPANSEQMQKISLNGQQFCRTKLTMEQYTVDMLWTLLAYAELLEGSPDFLGLWRADRDARDMGGMGMAPWRARRGNATG